MDNKKRCSWCLSSELYIDYHDNFWGVPVFDDKLIFEFLSLEGAQAGLNWLTVLKRRAQYSQAFNDFNIKKVAEFNDQNIAEIIQNFDVIKNQLKIKSVINNAKILRYKFSKEGSFSQFIWKYVNFKPVNNSFVSLNQIPSYDDISLRMSKELKKLGFTFVGPTICYAFMQAIGLVNDHLVDCYRYNEIRSLIF